MEFAYDPKRIEEKWQKAWAEQGVFKSRPDKARKKFYLLEMLPYPSGHLHMGHVRNYAIGDAFARYLVMNGFNVLHPMGWDAFGMPAENAAIKHGVHPADWTMDNIKKMREQFERLGCSYDWDREVATCEPSYYKWEQLVFLRMYERGLAYRKESFVNWCDNCETVLANEQVIGGACWRCSGTVRQRSMTQWYFRITDYAEELLKDIDLLERWPERVKTMQREWIGKSEGTIVEFELDSEGDDSLKGLKIEIFTTRADTLFGVTFLSLASEHPLVDVITKNSPNKDAIASFRDEVLRMDRMKRLQGDYEKKGVFTGRYCIHPLTREKIPIYIANFVLMDYGTGAVMAVPAHDQRDFEFAKRYNLPIKVVVLPVCKDGEKVSLDPNSMESAYVEYGVLTDSGEFSGLWSEDAIQSITAHLEKIGKGRRAVSWRLKDWCVSRQRYWGAPIPIIYCDDCGIVPVPESELPVVLPRNVEFTGTGGSPLAKVPSFVNTKCPRCGKPAKRETDTLDTFVESSWYFLRYCSPKYDKWMVDAEEARYWMPIDKYIGGIEHAVGHLLYFRFYMKVLRDLGIFKFSDSNEPAVELMTQGMVYKDGAKMSKSKGNVVSVDEMLDKYGADTARLFSLFAAPPEKDLEWSDEGVEGAYRFLGRVWRLVYNWKRASKPTLTQGDTASEVYRLLNKTIKKVTEDIERMHFNTAIAAIMEFTNALYQVDVSTITEDTLRKLIILLSPFAPHIAEELWQELGGKGFVYHEKWPLYDKDAVKDEEVMLIVQVNGRLRDKIKAPRGISSDEARRLALSSEKVSAHIGKSEIKNVIYVPDRLINLVV